jgi:ATP-binding cassette subfamily F protein uup
MIVLDEPTNDLDMETLELLEELLLEFSGTLLVVSHDRKFLDNVITQSIVFEAPGVVREYVGGYEDWIRQGGKMLSFEDEDVISKPAAATAVKAAAVKTETAAIPAAAPASAQPAKTSAPRHSQKVQRELDQITKQIEKLEADISTLEIQMAASGFYEQNPDVVQSALKKLGELQTKLEEHYARWEALESA